MTELDELLRFVVGFGFLRARRAGVTLFWLRSKDQLEWDSLRLGTTQSVLADFIGLPGVRRIGGGDGLTFSVEQ